MSDGFPDRLTQLRARWQGDPSSRVFLQLAEEYRHLGRVQEALEVLDRGLKEHPGYLSALVAKGRCLLELGDAEGARTVLERVVQQDATQMVANKLLVRACLDVGDPERARQRLDLYSLLNDSDPEIDELRRRVVAMSRSARVPDEPHPEEQAERSPMDGSGTPDGPVGQPAEVFDLGPAQPDRPLDLDQGIFDLGPPPPALPEPAAPASAPAVAAAPVTAAPPALPQAAATPQTPQTPQTLQTPAAANAGHPLPRGQGSDEEPFPDLAPDHSFHAYLSSLAAEQIFAFELPSPAPQPAEVQQAQPVAQVAEAAPQRAEPAPQLVETARQPAEPAPVEPRPQAEEPWHAPLEPLAPLPALPALPPLPPMMEQAAMPAVPEPPAAMPAPAVVAAAATPAPAEPWREAAAMHLQAAAQAPGPLETATLGELYLRQGHLSEAERIFREVVERDPGNAAALAALAEIDRRRQPLEAAHLLAGLDDPNASPASRKAYLLQSYLTRLRQVRSPHVP
jgi:tetratricopeptide (TPR) repeat protein